MDELRRYLQGGDPLEREPELAPADVDRMRRRMLDVTDHQAAHVPVAIVALAAGLSVVVAGGVWLVRSAPETRETSSPAALVGDRPDVRGFDRRQLQFSTPGGTRVIWEFDPHFD